MASNKLEELQFENVLKSVSEYIKYEHAKGDDRFKKLYIQFNDKFKMKSYDRGMAEGLIWSLFSIPLSLIYIGNYASVIVEIHGYLERFAISYLPQLLSDNIKLQKILLNQFHRKTLSELGVVFYDLGVWNKNDLNKIAKLGQIRNGIVHKNANILSKHLGPGKKLHILDAYNLTVNIDCNSWFLDSLELIIKIAKKLDKKDNKKE